MPGPAPKREAERARRNTPESGAARHGELRDVKIPTADKAWHPRAKEWYKSLKESGQADYFQNSDWAFARIVADALTIIYDANFNRQAMMLAEVNDMMAKLGTAEGHRRQILRVELEKPPVEEKSAAEAAVDLYKERLKRRPS